MKLLKLLIALEEFDMAAEGFSISKVRLHTPHTVVIVYFHLLMLSCFLACLSFEQMSNMKRALRSVESTGDTVAFAAELSTSFFTALQEACASFKTLFEEHYDKPEILNLLLMWVQQQVNAYVEILVPAVRATLYVVRVCI